MTGVIKGLLRLLPVSHGAHSCACQSSSEYSMSSENEDLTVLPFSCCMKCNGKGLCEIHSGALFFSCAVYVVLHCMVLQLE